MPLVLLKHSLSDDISESLLLIDSGMFLRMDGGWLDSLWTYNRMLPSYVRAEFLTSEVKRDI